MASSKVKYLQGNLSQAKIGLLLAGTLSVCAASPLRLKAEVTAVSPAVAQAASSQVPASFVPAIDTPAALKSPIPAAQSGPVQAPQQMQAFIAEATPLTFLPAPQLDLSESNEEAAAAALPAGAIIIAPNTSPPMPLAQCPYDQTHNPRCRMHWHQMVIEASLYLAFQNVGNAYTGYWYRWETLNGKWWDRYVNSVEDWRWTVWQDQNPFLDDYIGHSMMGAITNAIWEQNDPLGMTVVQANNWVYYRSRLRATAFSTFFSYEWKLGPIGEAGMHNGDHFFFENGQWTNETGWVELVTTPLGGLAWNFGEDYLDRTFIPWLENRSRNPFALLGYSFITPAKTMANILRFRAPWYRDSRVVKANSFWSDPPDDTAFDKNRAAVSPVSANPVTTPGNSPNVDSASLTAAWDRANAAEAAATPPSAAAVPAGNPPLATANTSPGPTPAASAITRVPPNPALTAPRWGGVHEFGAIWGFSVMTGHLWGNIGDVKTMTVAVRYSYLLHRGDSIALRYSPEFTALSMVDWPTPHGNIPYDANHLYDQRTRAYGSGISPIGFQLDLNPKGRVQPFFSTNEGAIYYDEKVFGINGYDQPTLPAEGPTLLYAVDFGGGINIFHHERQAITLGYRYQHLSGFGSNSSYNTDANVFYLGVSRFRTKHNTRVQ